MANRASGGTMVTPAIEAILSAEEFFNRIGQKGSFAIDSLTEVWLVPR
jgi:hypothetical protein